MLDISDEWAQKLAAIRCYESQFITGRSTDPPLFLDEAAYWGRNHCYPLRRTIHLREPIRLTTMVGLI